MKRILVIYNRIQYGINEWFALALSDRLRQNGNDVRLIMREDLDLPEGEENGFKYEGKEIEPPDIAVIRIIEPEFTRCLEAFGVRTVNNSRVSKICNDKKRSYLLAKKAGVPFADFFEIGRRKGLPPEVGYPLVVKTVSGHGGKEVRLCRNENDVNEAVRAAGKEKLIAQKLVGDGKSGKDLRVYVLGGRIFKAVLRSSEIDFRSNFSLGGKAEPYTLSPEEEETVYKIVRELKSPDLIGADFLVTEEGLLFNEIEDVVGTRMLYAVYGIDAAKVFADYVSGL